MEYFNIWSIPKDMLKHINCEKAYINGRKISSIFWFRNHIRVSTDQGEYRYFKEDHPNMEIKFV